MNKTDKSVHILMDKMATEKYVKMSSNVICARCSEEKLIRERAAKEMLFSKEGAEKPGSP